MVKDVVKLIDIFTVFITFRERIVFVICAVKLRFEPAE
jgi:hypothetical protein